VTNHPQVGLVVALLCLFGVGTVVWLWTTTEPAVSPPLSSARSSGSDAEHNNRVETFFGGDPDRDVRNGQEMKPRW